MVSASGEAVFATMIVIVGLSTVATAICYLLIGWFGLAHLFRFMPYPLVGGFLAGIGWFLVKSSVAVASGITMTWEALPALGEIDTIQKWAPGVFYGALLLVVTKIRPHYLILPVSAVVAIGVCHAVLYALDIPLAEATASGLLFAGIPAGLRLASHRPGRSRSRGLGCRDIPASGNPGSDAGRHHQPRVLRRRTGADQWC